MSVAILLVLPIFLSGYTFANRSLYHKYRLIRIDGYHLYFTSASYGVLITLASAGIYLISYHSFPEFIFDLVRSFKDSVTKGLSITTPSVFPLLVIGIFSLLLSSWLGKLSNKIIPRQESHYRAIKDDELELLFYEAAYNKKSVQISLGTDKVYVGVIANSFIPEEERKYIRIVPLKSGYRHPETKVVTFNTHYEEVIDYTLKNVLEGVDIKNKEKLEDAKRAIDDLLAESEILLPVSEIKAAHIYSDIVRKSFEVQRKKANKKQGKKK